jgi:alpha-tubulin suppressor-like RCC1 family protein
MSSLKHLPRGRLALIIAQALLVLVSPLVSSATYPLATFPLVRDEESSLDFGLSSVLIVNPNGTVLERTNEGGIQRVPGLSSIVAVSTGENFNMALRADGSVWTWGGNIDGQLGLGHYEYQSTPVQIPGLQNVVAISAGRAHALALKSDGSVWAWGANFQGEVGNGQFSYPQYWPYVAPTGVAVHTPQPMEDSAGVVSGVIAISAGDSFSLLVKSDNTVWGCGSNYSAQLSYSTVPEEDPPGIYTKVIQVTGLSNVVKVAAGRESAVALRADSSVWAWGSNTDGTIGDGSEHQELLWSPDEEKYFRAGRLIPPQAVPNMTGVVKIAAAGSSVMVQKENGTLWAWGDEAGIMNYYSEAIDGYITGGRNTPVQVAEATQAMVLAGSPSTSTLAAGFPSPGPSADFRRMELDPWVTGEPPPSTPPRLRSGSFSVPLGLYESDKRFHMQLQVGPYMYALGDAGTVFAWGAYHTATPSPVSYPAAPSDLVSLNSGVSSYVAPYGNQNILSIGLTSGGTLLKWRANLGSLLPAVTPTAISGISDVVAVSGAERSASYALKRDGTVWILAGSGATPTQQGNISSMGSAYVDMSSLAEVQQIAAGKSFGLALKKNGTVWGWGSNLYGALGNYAASHLSVPSQIAGINNVKSIYVGSNMVHAIKSDGTVWAWGTGYPGNGQIMNSQKIPTEITQLKGTVSIYCNPNANGNAYAINGNGRVYSWGPSNSYGTLGLGPVNSAATPTLIPGLENVVEAYITNIAGFFRLENGLIYSCGGNQGVGLLGTGVVNSSISYSPVVTLF